MKNCKGLLEYEAPEMDLLDINIEMDVLTASQGTGGTIDPGEPIGD